MKPWDLHEVYIRTRRHGNTTACARGALAAGAVLVVPTEQDAQRARSMVPGVRTFSLARGAEALAGTVDAYVVDPWTLAVIATEWDAQVSRAERERDEARRELAEARDEIGRLRADLAEAQATIANERGEGEPPEEGWSPMRQSERDSGEHSSPDDSVVMWGMVDTEAHRCAYVGTDAHEGDRWWWAVHVGSTPRGVVLATGRAATGRAAIIAATDAAKGGDDG